MTSPNKEGGKERIRQEIEDMYAEGLPDDKSLSGTIIKVAKIQEESGLTEEEANDILGEATVDFHPLRKSTTK